MEAANNISGRIDYSYFMLMEKSIRNSFRNNLAQFIKNNYYQEYASSLNLYKEKEKWKNKKIK